MAALLTSCMNKLSLSGSFTQKKATASVGFKASGLVAPFPRVQQVSLSCILCGCVPVPGAPTRRDHRQGLSRRLY